MVDIKGYEGKYAVTSCGKVWSYKRNKFLTPAGYGKGYLQVCLGDGKKGNQTMKYVHRLVAEAYIPNPDNLPQVNHKDENRENNNVNNLEWCTHQYNINYGTRNDKLSAKRKGRPSKKPVYCVELDRTFESINAAVKALGIRSNLSQCLSGVNETCAGYHWRYAD